MGKFNQFSIARSDKQNGNSSRLSPLKFHTTQAKPWFSIGCNIGSIYFWGPHRGSHLYTGSTYTWDIFHSNLFNSTMVSGRRPDLRRPGRPQRWWWGRHCAFAFGRAAGLEVYHQDTIDIEVSQVIGVPPNHPFIDGFSLRKSQKPSILRVPLTTIVGSLHKSSGQTWPAQLYQWDKRYPTSMWPATQALRPQDPAVCPGGQPAAQPGWALHSGLCTAESDTGGDLWSTGLAWKGQGSRVRPSLLNAV